VKQERGQTCDGGDQEGAGGGGVCEGRTEALASTLRKIVAFTVSEVFGDCGATCVL
jgi:hypothetical protein